jgi:hypothetical protein
MAGPFCTGTMDEPATATAIISNTPQRGRAAIWVTMRLPPLPPLLDVARTEDATA